MRTITEIYVHCSASSPSETVGIDLIGDLHEARGISRPCGYHAFIPRKGGVESGRPIERAGAHVKGHNANSIGICLEGGLKDDGLTIKERIAYKRWGTPDMNFTHTQLADLKTLLDSYLVEFPNAEVKGHRDAPGVKKACPCFDVRAWYYGGDVVK
jgi:N-acetylmuramoyl-L-alanine amidase